MDEQPRTCLVAGKMPMDVLRTHPSRGVYERYYVHVGGTAGNVATMLAAQFGWHALPVARLDGSDWGFRIKAELARYGADIRFVSNADAGGTTLFTETSEVDKEGNPIVRRRSSTPAGGAFPSYRYLTSDAARALADGLRAAPPDVFFFDQPAGGHRTLAEALRPLGTLVWFEVPEPSADCPPSAVAKCVEAADVVKFSDEDRPDASFAEGAAGKLVVQTMGAKGVRFKLRGAGWRELPPVANPGFVDGEGAGDWTSAAFLAALGRRGLPRIADLDEATVADCLREAQEMASRSTSFRGSKGLIEDRFPTLPEYLDATRDPPPPPVPPKKPRKPKPGFEDMVFAPDPVERKKGWTVFLAGPIGFAPQWQRSVPRLAKKLGLEGVTWLNPRGRKTSVVWETQGFRLCDVALFWIPKAAEAPGPGDKPYAHTTQLELAENLARGKRIVLGIEPDGLPYDRHARFLAKRYGVKVRESLEECLLALKGMMGDRKPAEHVIDGPGFGSKEVLRRHPECVDMLALNQLLMERWNRDIAPDDVVHVRGGFGDRAWLPLLNGDIRFD